MKFSGDLVYLVLIRGSNLDRPHADTTINLTTAGLQRHRVVWVKEMTEEEIRSVGEAGPTIDSIQVGEFESHAALHEWLEKTGRSSCDRHAHHRDTMYHTIHLDTASTQFLLRCRYDYVSGIA